LWDKAADEPAEYAEGGEPENYILERPHDVECAAALGSLSELVLEKQGAAQIDVIRPAGPRILKIVLTLLSEPSLDFFLAEGSRFTFVTERAKNWLTENELAGYAEFQEAEVEYGGSG
jgi:hypothetical protein